MALAAAFVWQRHTDRDGDAGPGFKAGSGEGGVSTETKLKLGNGAKAQGLLPLAPPRSASFRCCRRLGPQGWAGRLTDVEGTF